MERELEFDLNDGRQVTVIYEVTWQGETYGEDADGNRGMWTEGPVNEGFDVIFEGSELPHDSLTKEDLLKISASIDSDLESVDREEFEPEYEKEIVND